MLGLIVTLAFPSALAAQSVTLRLGGFRTSYADSLSARAASASAEGLWWWRAARLGVSGGIATFDGGGWSAQGAVTAARVLAGNGSRALFTTADAAGYAFAGGAGAGTANAGLGATVSLGPVAATATLAGGGVRRVDGVSDPLVQATARLRRERGAFAADAWLSGARVGDTRYGDVAASLQVTLPRLLVEATGGGRFGDLGDMGWGQARAARRIAGPGWIEAAAGRYPPDVAGFSRGTYVQAGLRLTLGRGARDGLMAATGVETRRGPGGTVVVTFLGLDRAPAGIAGDWNDWAPEPLERLDARRWRARITAAPGLHRFTLLDAAGRPFVPGGIPTEPDDFGGTSGLLTIPHR